MVTPKSPWDTPHNKYILERRLAGIVLSLTSPKLHLILFKLYVSDTTNSGLIYMRNQDPQQKKLK
jgi:hypothetical protein